MDSLGPSFLERCPANPGSHRQRVSGSAGDRSGCDGERYAYTPALGLYRSPMSANGDVLVGEGRLRTLLAGAEDGSILVEDLEQVLGTPWDQELEVYRHAGEGAPVRWLHQVV